MHFAVLTDVHGNLAALEAVLRDMDLKAPQVDIFDLGDLLDGGPSPSQVLTLARSRVKAFLQGNHEIYQRDCASNPHWEYADHRLWKLVPFGVQALGDRLLPFLAQQTFSLSPGPNVTLLHASLASSSRVPDFFPDQGHTNFNLPCRHILEAKEFYFMGHSHHPGIEKDPQGNFWINCGSVGYPFLKSPEAFLGEPSLTRPSLTQPSFGEPLSSDLKSVLFPKSNWVEVKSLDARDGFRRLEVSFHVVSYDGDALIREWVESDALETGAPFSWAILAQSLFNEDITYPLFRRAKGLSRKNLEIFFDRELERLALKERILGVVRDQSLSLGLSRLI